MTAFCSTYHSELISSSDSALLASASRASEPLARLTVMPALESASSRMAWCWMGRSREYIELARHWTRPAFSLAFSNSTIVWSWRVASAASVLDSLTICAMSISAIPLYMVYAARLITDLSSICLRSCGRLARVLLMAGIPVWSRSGLDSACPAASQASPVPFLVDMMPSAAAAPDR